MDDKTLRLMYDLMAHAGVPCHVHVMQDITSVEFLTRKGEPQYLNMPCQVGDRWITAQFFYDGQHRISFMEVTKEGMASSQGPMFLHGWVVPTGFDNIESMWIALEIQSKKDFGERPGQ